MQFDGTINIPTLVAIIGMAVTVIVWLTRMEARVNSAVDAVTNLSKRVDALSHELKSTEASFDEKVEKLDASFSLRIEGIRGLVDMTRDAFAESKVQMARDYATNQAVGQIKSEIIGELKNTEQRIEQNLTRLLERERR